MVKVKSEKFEGSIVGSGQKISGTAILLLALQHRYYEYHLDEYLPLKPGVFKISIDGEEINVQQKSNYILVRCLYGEYKQKMKELEFHPMEFDGTRNSAMDIARFTNRLCDCTNMTVLHLPDRKVTLNKGDIVLKFEDGEILVMNRTTFDKFTEF